jgi:hypothetical protein
VAKKIVMKLIRAKITTICYVKERYRDMEVTFHRFLEPDKGEWPASCLEDLIPVGKVVVVAC